MIDMQLHEKKMVPYCTINKVWFIVIHENIQNIQVIVSDYAAMDRVLREERAYILDIVKQIKKAGCNVLLIQKSILRDAISDLALHFFDKMKIMVIKDVEREDIEHVCKSLGCSPVASLDHFTADKLASADLVEEVSTGNSFNRQFRYSNY